MVCKGQVRVTGRIFQRGAGMPGSGVKEAKRNAARLVALAARLVE